MFFDELEKEGLVKIYYRCNQFTICRLVDWTIMALPKAITEYRLAAM